MEHWNKKLTDLVVRLYENGKTYREINIIIKNKRTEKSIRRKIERLGCKRKRKIYWNKELINYVIELIKQGKNYKEISVIINKSQNSINHELNRRGYKFGHINRKVKILKRLKSINWSDIQKQYDGGLGYRGIIKLFKISHNDIVWAKKKNLIKFRSISDAVKKARELGKFPKVDKNYNDSIIRYRELCKFKFNVYDYPNEFDLILVDKHGWYKAKNRGDNLKGVSKDHKYSVKEGFLNKINPNILSHPANCRLMLHNDNVSKNSKCLISLKDLKNEIIKWNKKYGKFKNIGN